MERRGDLSAVYKVGGTEILAGRQFVAGGEIYHLDIRSRSSLDYSSVVLNMTAAEFGDLVRFLGEFGKSSG